MTGRDKRQRSMETMRRTTTGFINDETVKIPVIFGVTIYSRNKNKIYIPVNTKHSRKLRKRQ